MTTFEHAMLGASTTIAFGLHHKHGWKLMALSALSAIVPDWDGLTVLFDTAMFDRGHRVWGHNIFACAAVGLLLGFIDYRFDLFGQSISRLAQTKTFRNLSRYATIRIQRTRRDLITWILVAICAALSQIPADAVVSGGHGLADWPVQPLWPVSSAELVWAMVPWGEPWDYFGVLLWYAGGRKMEVAHSSNFSPHTCCRHDLYHRLRRIELAPFPPH